MANIQPFDYQESTNIEEHNQIVNKVNEIVEVINNVNLETINSEIADLKSKATATDTEIASIKDKDVTQDTEINGITKNLVSNVTATFDNPSRELKISLGREASPSIDATVVIPASSETGQYSAGNGITIENYQIAVDTGVVALKTDIPVVPDVSEITTRLDTIDGEITGINTDITNITNKNTEQDTAINGKVAIAQGIENAGKVLGIGSDGNVTLVDAGGGEVWEEVDLNNWPTDWVAGDRIRIISNIQFNSPFPSNWGSAPSGGSYATGAEYREIEYILYGGGSGNEPRTPIWFYSNNYICCLSILQKVGDVVVYNRANNDDVIIQINTIYWNGGGRGNQPINIDHSNKASYINKMYRLRKA